MSEQRLKGWNKQKTAFTYAEEREFGPGLRNALLYADLGLTEATGGNFHGEIIKKSIKRNIPSRVRPVCTVMTMTFNLTMS